jgi:purine-binding chemotaxis protein CheW
MPDSPAPHSPRTAAITERRNTTQFVGFQIDGQDYAFRIEQIREIVIRDRVTPMPRVPDYVEGVSTLRGAIIPIINLSRLFGMAQKPNDEETRTIVVNVHGRTMGCTVDAVSQVIRIPEESIQPAPDTMTADGAKYISGFAKLGERLVVLLDIEELLNPDRLERQRRSETPSPPSSLNDIA